MPLADTYWRAAAPYYTVDGDTIRATIDAGHRQYSAQTIRLLGVNAPELHDRDPEIRAKANAAKQFVIDWLVEHAAHNTDSLTWGDREVFPFNIQSKKGDSFDRWLALVTCQLGHDLSSALLQAGLAVPFM